MEVYGSGTTSVRKEITCVDCGHVYLIAQGQPSARCQSCGNIEFFASGEVEFPRTADAYPKKLSAFSQAIASRVLPRLSSSAPADPLLPFRATPDGLAVEDLRIRYQVEWQLWAALVKNFQDPAHHMAYICQATASHQLETAAQRYKEHRSVMALLADSRWQAEVSDLMLSRIEAISLMRMQSDAGGWWTQLPARFYLMRTDSRAMRYLWVLAGVVIFTKLFSLVWWK